MSKRTFFFILAGLSLIASVVLVIVGVKRAEQKPILDGLKSLGRITLTYDEEKTVNFMNSKDGQTVDPEAQSEPYTVVFTNNQTQYGLIRYDLGVDTKAEFDELTAATADFVYTGDGFVEEGDSTQSLRRSTKQVYVYAWPKTEEESKNTPEDENSKYWFKFEDYARNLYDISEEIDPSPKVSSTLYFILAAIPLLGGAYLLFLGLTADRKRMKSKQ